MGTFQKFPPKRDSEELLVSRGIDEWYGPLRTSADPSAVWYIRPVFIPHWEKPTQQASVELEGFSNTPQQFFIRWLCFARIESDVVSLHWNGFSHTNEIANVDKNNSQHKYWEYVPNLFRELEGVLQTRFSDPFLTGLILDELWDKFRRDKQNYYWHDTKIRAEAGGVFLNANTVGPDDSELDLKGINRLANTIRRAIEVELSTNYSYSLPDPTEFDEVILRTLIKDFGPLSNAFQLSTTNNMNIFSGHVYFGAKPSQSSSDSFPHINLQLNYRDAFDQIDFILNHLKTYHAKRNQPDQLSLF